MSHARKKENMPGDLDALELKELLDAGSVTIGEWAPMRAAAWRSYADAVEEWEADWSAGLKLAAPGIPLLARHLDGSAEASLSLVEPGLAGRARACMARVDL